MKKILNNVFKDEVISLYPVTLKYLNDFHEYSSNPIFFRYFEYSEFKSRNKSKKYLNNLIKNSKKKNFQCWNIILNNKKKCIGTITVNINPIRNSAELGYGLNPRYWGKGYFLKSLVIIENFLFKNVRIKRLFAITNIKNKKSIKPLLQFGFKIEGHLRSFYKKNNNYLDAIIISKINKN